MVAKLLRRSERLLFVKIAKLPWQEVYLQVFECDQLNV